MTILTLILSTKILVSIVILALPLLFWSKETLGKTFQVTAETPLVFRLYGMAILSLLVAYAGGIWQITAGHFPWGSVCAGVVSNIGAPLILMTFGAQPRSHWPEVFFLMIGIGLIWSLANAEAAIAPLF